MDKLHRVLDRLGGLLIVASIIAALAALCVYLFVGPVLPYKPYLPQMTVAAVVLLVLGLLLVSVPTEDSVKVRGYTSVAAVYLEWIGTIVGVFGTLGCFGLSIYAYATGGLLPALPWFVAFVFCGLIAHWTKWAQNARLERMDPAYKATERACQKREIREREEKRAADRVRWAEQEERDRKARVQRELKKAGLICPACGSEDIVCIKRSNRTGAMMGGAAMSTATNDPLYFSAALAASAGKETMLCKNCGKKFKR